MKTLRIQTLLRVVAVSSALALGGAAVHAQPMGPRDGGPGNMAPGGLFGDRMDHLLDLVNATDAQRTQIENIFKSARQDLAGQRDAGKKQHAQMLALYTATNVDAAAIEALRVQISASHDAASKRLSQASIEAARVLSPEQRAKIAEMMKKRQARMAGRHAG